MANCPNGKDHKGGVCTCTVSEERKKEIKEQGPKDPKAPGKPGGN